MKLIDMRPMMWVDDVEATIIITKLSWVLQRATSKMIGSGDG
jgi:hypothetical protein